MEFADAHFKHGADVCAMTERKLNARWKRNKRGNSRLFAIRYVRSGRIEMRIRTASNEQQNAPLVACTILGQGTAGV
eukprot:scaffold179587_cov29-Tisochrysis_lutea.AAC.1